MKGGLPQHLSPAKCLVLPFFFHILINPKSHPNAQIPLFVCVLQGLLTIGLSCLVLTSLNAPTFGPGTAIVAVPAGIAIAGPLGAGIIPTR